MFIWLLWIILNNWNSFIRPSGRSSRNLPDSCRDEGFSPTCLRVCLRTCLRRGISLLTELLTGTAYGVGWALTTKAPNSLTCNTQIQRNALLQTVWINSFSRIPHKWKQRLRSSADSPKSGCLHELFKDIEWWFCFRSSSGNLPGTSRDPHKTTAPR